jgi:hypothetical protein
VETLPRGGDTSAVAEYLFLHIVVARPAHETKDRDAMLVTFKMKYVQHWIDHLGRKRYRVRRHINGKLTVLGELPVNGDPSSPEFQAAYHALLRGEKTDDVGRQRHRAR